MRIFFNYLLFFVLFSSSIACSSSDSSENNTDSTAVVPIEEELVGSNGMIPAGKYCYFFADDISEGVITLEVTQKFGVKGTIIADIHDEANSYFTKSETNFKGVMNNDIIEAKGVTVADGATVNEDLMLKVGDDWIKRDDRLYKLDVCK